MKLSNKDKHQLAVRLISDHLINNHFEHLVFSSDREMDIYVPEGDTKIKVFCNYSGSKNLKISSDFETQEGVLYLVVKPTRKNIHGFSCVGGDKSIIDKSIKFFDGEGSPKNIQTEFLRIVSITKFIEGRKDLIEQKQDDSAVIDIKCSNIISTCVKKCRTPMLSSYALKSFPQNLIAQH